MRRIDRGEYNVFVIETHMSKRVHWWAVVLLGAIAWFIVMMVAKYNMDPRLGSNDFIVFYAAATFGFDQQSIYHNDALFAYINLMIL